MNYNVIAYCIYLILTVFVIVFVGKHFYRNGRIFILGLMKDDAVTTDYFNNILLVAYYLYNIGYAFVKMLISSISNNMSVLIFILASTHYMNMILIWYLSRSKQSFFHHKTFQS
jgi:hypothetical protein